MSTTLSQKPLFFDHILGLRDVLTGGKKGPSTAAGDLANTQKKVYRLSPSLPRGNAAGPIADAEIFKTILDYAISGEDTSMECTFYKTDAPQITLGTAKIASLSIDIKAGDVAQFSVEVVGKTYTKGAGSSSKIDCVKLITWDACSVVVTCDDVDVTDIVSFNLTINNPVTPIYGLGELLPKTLRIGMQEVTGSLGVYGTPPVGGKTGTIAFSLGDNIGGKTVEVVFHDPKDDANSGLFVNSVSFVGVAEASIWS